MRLIFAGTPDGALPSLEALLASEHDVVGVVTRPDAPAGRGRFPRPSPVAERAEQAGVEVLKPARLNDALDQLRQLRPDCCPVVAYGAMVRRDALDVPPLGWVNLHFSLLPAWRGAAPVQHALLRGDDVTGATVFRLDEGLDTGPVLSLMTETIRPRDTSGDLLDRLSSAGAGLLVSTLDALAQGEIEPRPQPADGVSYAPKLSPDDARVDWTEPAAAVDRRVRACTPAPGAWTAHAGERLGLGPVEPVTVVEGLAPGVVQVGRREVLVGCGDGRAVRLGNVRPAGRKVMAADAWARGVRDLDGSALGA